MNYLIWSNEHRGWWGPGRRGYVKSVMEAGRYGHAEAMSICAEALGTAGHLGILAELPVREDDLAAFLTGRIIPVGLA